MIEVRWMQAMDSRFAALKGIKYSYKTQDDNSMFKITQQDCKLMSKLAKKGGSEAKFRRMIAVFADIKAPLYWWKQMDRYKVGTESQSESTMHTIAKNPFKMSDFSTDGGCLSSCLPPVLETLNKYRDLYLATRSEDYWRTIIQLLPESYNQSRIFELNYEVLYNIVHQREGHKLSEWRGFIEACRSLWMSDELIFVEDKGTM